MKETISNGRFLPALLLALSLLLPSCSPDDVPVSFVGTCGKGERVSVSMSLDGEPLQDATKASLLEGSESVRSGATVVVYYSDTGLLDSVQEFGADCISIPGTPASDAAVLSLPKDREVLIYVLGNLWAVEKATGERASLSIALTEAFPSTPAELEAWPYRLDGSDINSVYRYQTLSEVAAYGIPFSGSVPSDTYSEGETLSVSCRRLFSKLSLTVDHSGLDGGLDPDYFRNVKLHLRQANCRLQPFGSEPQKALSSSDIIEGDYDPAMVNASSMIFELYVPENMQGTLLPGNTDPALKDYDSIVAEHDAATASLLSYVEFSAEVNSSAGGYGGPVTYRFYLGEDNCSNFDLERHRRYDVSLGFSVSSLFEPDWKVSASLTDSREIGISADASYSRPLPSGQMVALRKNRPARLYAYVKAGQGGIPRLPDGLRDPGYNPSDLTRCPLTSDFLSQSNLASDVPARAKLQELGITAEYDESSGLLSFTVSDQSKFIPGKELELNLMTVPAGKSVSFTLKTFENMSVSWDGSLTDAFLPGMSRTASIQGYSAPLSYRCGTEHSYKHTVSEDSADMIFSNYESNPVTGNGSFSIYNFFYCKAPCCVNSSLYLRCGDDFNDGNNDGVLDDADALVYEISNSKPEVQFRGVDNLVQVKLDMAGNEEEIYPEVRMKTGDSSYRSFYYTDFDPDVFAIVYRPRFVIEGQESELVDAEGNIIYKGTEDSYIGLKQTSRTIHSGWPVYELYRCKIGDDYSSWKEVTFKNYNLMYMQSPFSHGSFAGCNKSELSISLMPFISKNFGAGFASSYDDYTLWNSEHLDYAYRMLASSSISADSGNDMNFNLKSSDGLSLYAKPQASTESASLVDGRSGSIEISQASPGGSLSMNFVEDGSCYHTAGPHIVCASVTNKHSGELREEQIGEFDVYVHFIVGLQTDIISGDSGDYAGTVLVHPELISAVERTSYWTQYAANPVEVFVTKAGIAEYESSEAGRAAIVFNYDPGIVGSYADAVVAHPSVYGTFDTMIEYTAEAQLDSYGNYYTEAYSFMQECSYEDMNYLFCQLLSDSDMLDVKFNNYSSAGMILYDETAWDDLVTPSGKGYYIFHRLGDLRSDSNNWIPLFNYNAGL